MVFQGLNPETDLDMTSPLDGALAQTAWRYEELLKDIRRGAESLIRTLQDTLVQCDRALDGDIFSLNSCGIVQGAGPRIDRDCAVLAIRGEELRTLIALRKLSAKGSACRC